MSLHCSRERERERERESACVRENACVHERDREFTMGESTSIPTWRNSVFIVVVIEASNVKYQLITLRDKIKLMLHITKNCVSTLKHEKTQKL